jgi:sulfur carrier protein ThiS
VELLVERAGRATPPRVVWVATGTKVRVILRESGHAPEGSAVLVDGVSIPLDTPVERPVRLTILPTFSGG